MKSKLNILKEIESTQTHKKVKCRNGKVLIDAITAKAILLIYNNLKKEENKEKFLNWDWDKIANYAWTRCKFSF